MKKLSKTTMFLAVVAMTSFTLTSEASAATMWVDWTSISAADTTGATITGSVGGATVTGTLGGSAEFNSGTILDGTSTSFSSADYTPSIANTDKILQRFYHTGDTITITFSLPVVNPRIHLNGVQTLVNSSSLPQDVMSYSGTPTKLSGTADWSISGNNHRWTSGTRTAELNGTVEFDGTYSSITVTRLLDLGTAWDTHGMQVTVESVVPEPSAFLLATLGLLRLGLRRRR
ncbi:MAG: hypothetical protein ABF377_05820 [Akkermansiaceae bacterium]